MHLGKDFLAAIFSVIMYCVALQLPLIVQFRLFKDGSQEHCNLSIVKVDERTFDGQNDR